MSGSIATLAEAIHSVADTANQALLLFGMKRAEKPADPNSPFAVLGALKAQFEKEKT